MEPRPYREADAELAGELLGRIYLGAREEFFGARKAGKLLAANVYAGKGNKGIQVIYTLEDFTVCYISFQKDPGKAALRHLEKALEPYTGHESLFLNMNAGNPAVVAHFLGRGFRKDRESLEYCFSGEDWPKSEIPNDIVRRDFDEDDFEDYIWLLDTAFRPQLIREGQPLDPYRRNRERSLSVLGSAAESGDFASYWKGDSIIGLYLLRGRIILNIAVTPVYQGSGIGSAMLSEILGVMAGSGESDPIVAYMSAENTSARHLYEKFGFRQTASHVDTAYVPPQRAPDNIIKQ